MQSTRRLPRKLRDERLDGSGSIEIVDAAWFYAAHGHRLLGSHLTSADASRIGRSYLVGPSAYAVGAALGLLGPWVSLGLFLAVNVSYLWPSRIDMQISAGTGQVGNAQTASEASGGLPSCDRCDSDCHKWPAPRRNGTFRSVGSGSHSIGQLQVVLQVDKEKPDSSVIARGSRDTYSNGPGERIRADTPSRSLLIPVTNVPTSASSDAAPRFGQHQAVARAFSRPSRIRSRPYSKSSP